MPPRPSTTALLSAQTAEFNAKKWVWVPDEKEGYVSGWVNKEFVEGDEEVGEVVLNSGEIRRVPLYTLNKMNPPKFDRVDDIADLTFLNEASVVHNLRLRYGSGSIYTYSGLFLVAINPYQSLPLYSDSIITQYRSKPRSENPPHIFAVAERAWVNMGEERENQSILITGESGAGKTESTKKVIQYLAAIATDAHLGEKLQQQHTRSLSSASLHSRSPSLLKPSTSGSGFTSKSRLGLLERQILQANPILESFGNAQTQRNNNSSRFGKFIRISFLGDGSIAGANIDWYLLEKSRVVMRSENERSFHVFYQIFRADIPTRERLLLGGEIGDYEYLNKSRREIDGVDDGEEWQALKAALDIVGFTPTEQFDLFRIVAAILHIGNIQITSTRSDDSAIIADPSQIERVCHLLGVPIQEFTRAIIKPRVLAGREWVTQARTREQALAELASLSKTLYEKSFGLLVSRINSALSSKSTRFHASQSFIGVLDIAGFEIFPLNTYEQLLINYTNEKLQQFFNHHMFVLEQEEYEREGIEWDYVNFGLDLKPTIDLIESTGTNSDAPNTIGILSLLDEECIMPKATDLTFTHKLHSLSANHEKYLPPSKFGAERDAGFMIRHYAADVYYSTEGWLEKNRDPLGGDLKRVMGSATESFVARLFDEEKGGKAGGGTIGRKTGKGGAFRTVGQRHKEQLSSLMAQLHATQPHFVRCIVPNALKRPLRMDVPLVLDQLRCNGVLEGIRIARLGYPNRLPFVEFRARYEVLVDPTSGVLPKRGAYMDGREACRLIVRALELDAAIYKIGTSKIFFKAGVLADLEERRSILLSEIFSKVQAAARQYTARRGMKKILNRASAVRVIQRNARVYGHLRDWPWWQLYTKVRPLLAATRNDEELRRKEVELALITERAERDQREKEALESLKNSLEAEKKQVEDLLEAERALAVDKDALLERSKKREAELEEEIAEYANDVDALDSQLERAMKLQKESEDKYRDIRTAFDEAAAHLVRLEAQGKTASARETQLEEQLKAANAEIEALQNDIDQLEKVGEELKSLALQKEEDLERLRERMDGVARELEGKLEVELRNKELVKTRLDNLESEARQSKEQFNEMARTANEYSSMIQKKEDSIRVLSDQLSSLQAEKIEIEREVIALQSDIETVAAELDAERGEASQGKAREDALRKELDELRKVMERKTSEESRRLEVSKSKEAELTTLRTQLETIKKDLADSRRSAIEEKGKMKSESEQRAREVAALQDTLATLQDKESNAMNELAHLRSQLSDVEKSKRAVESELGAVRQRQTEKERELEDALKAKETAERQLATAQTKYHNIEDVMLQMERDTKSSEEAHKRQVESYKKRLDESTSLATSLEKDKSSLKSELSALQQKSNKTEADIKAILKELGDKSYQVRQLEAKQDKTIVEHVHVLQEAKRRTDQQLSEAQAELARNAVYIRSLEGTKQRLVGEIQDLTRVSEREQLEIRTKERQESAEKTRTEKAREEAMVERKAKEIAELNFRRLENELRAEKSTKEDLERELKNAKRSKDNLEAELDRLANETVAPNSMAKMQRNYETRIAELEAQLNSNDLVAKLRERVERQHNEVRELIMNSGGPATSDFQWRLLQELETIDEELAKEFSRTPLPNAKSPTTRTFANVPSSKMAPKSSSVASSSSSSVAVNANSANNSALRSQIHLLELQLSTSNQIRSQLEQSLTSLSQELDTVEPGNLGKWKDRLRTENKRLLELLKESYGVKGEPITVIKNVVVPSAEDEGLKREVGRLEESRKALLLQHQTTLSSLESQRAQIRDLTHSRKQMQSEVTDLKEQLIAARNDLSATKKDLQRRIQDEELSRGAEGAANAELRTAVESYQAKEKSYQKSLDDAEIARAKAARSEALIRKSLTDLEKAHSSLLSSHKALESQVAAAERTIQALQARLDDDGRESGDLVLLNQRLAEELEDLKNGHQKDLEERDFASDQTRKKYQAEFASLSEELQAQRDTLTRLREENRKIRSDYDELQLAYDDEVFKTNSSGLVKEKERLETKIHDLTKAFEMSSAAQSEQQSQIVALHSQVRELRGALDDVEADRALLQKARRALQAELDGIKLDNTEGTTSKISADQRIQILQLEKQDLERNLDEQQDRTKNTFERLKRAETFATECQVELGKIRVDNSELDRVNATLEKQIKELNLRIVDLETRSLSTASPRSTISRRAHDPRIDEITSQLQGSSRLSIKLPPGESERQKLKFEEERRLYDSQISSLREQLSAMQSEEAALQSAKRRVEREAADYKQKVLSLERELDRLRGRVEPRYSSPASSPRK